MRKLVFSLLLFLLATNSNISLGEVSFDDRCITSSSDPYDTGAAIGFGKNKGTCMSNKARPVIETKESEERFILRETIGVANISHNGEFYQAEIPMYHIEKAIFVLELFDAPVPASHTMIRLKFDKAHPVVMRLQDTAKDQSPVFTWDLLLSIEALGERGFTYDVVKGLAKKYTVVHRLKTLDYFVKRVIIGKGSTVKQWEMRMTKNERRKLIVSYVNASDKLGYGVYNTLTKNCTTELLKVVDASTRPSFQKNFGRHATFDFYPSIIKPALKARGLYRADLDDLDQDPSVTHLIEKYM